MIDNLTVKVIDPVSKSFYKAWLKETTLGFQLDPIPKSENLPETDLFLSPGWIDLHAHVLDGFTSLSVTPDAAGLDTGVHLVVDAGSAGEATLPGFRKYVVPQFETEVRAWLNISSIGLVHLREVASLNLIDVDRTVQAVRDNQPFICGIKVRSSGAIVGEMGLQPLKLAKLAARETGLPVMVHIGEAPPVIDDVLDLLDEGDVITHCYHGKIGTPWKATGLPIDALEKAIAKGVKMDVGHGAASFSLDVCRHAIGNGFIPYTISTDLHIRNINGPVYDLATTMSKLLHCGMTLEDVITSVTVSPADVLGLKEWCRLDNIIQHATLFRLSNNPKPDREYRDSKGQICQLGEVIVPTGVITSSGFKSLK